MSVYSVCVWNINGETDLLACRAGRLYLLECKTGKKPLTDTQRDFIAEGWPVKVVRTAEEARQAVGLRL